MITFLSTCLIDYFSKDQWITIIFTLIGLFGSVGIAYWIFNAEQVSRELEEKKLNEDHFKILGDFLKMQIPYYKKQIHNIDLYLNNLHKHLNLEIVVELYNDYSKNFELMRLIQHINLNRSNVDNFNKLYSSINYTSIIIKNLEDEMLRFFERAYIIDEKMKSVQYHLLRTHLIEIEHYCLNDDLFNKDFGKLKNEYFKLVETAGENPKIFPKSDNDLVDKNLLETEFVDKLISIINPVFTKHPIFTEIGSKLNTFKNAINDKRNLELSHKSTMNSYISTLKHSLSSIQSFYKLN